MISALAPYVKSKGSIDDYVFLLAAPDAVQGEAK